MKLHLFLISSVLICSLISCSKKSTEPLSDTAAAPAFSLPSYMYYGGEHLSMSSTTPGAAIRYTIDGATPNEHSNLYLSPITMDSSMTVKARVYKKGLNPSSTTTGIYEIYNSSGNDLPNISELTANPDSIYADNGVTHSIISLKIIDANGLRIPGQLVKFRASIGNIQANATTDSAGIAQAMFWADDVSGVSTIFATVQRYHPDFPDFLIAADTAWVEVSVLPALPEPAEVQSLQFVNHGQIDLNVVNTGGVTSALLQVKLLDENGELVTTPQDVWFKIANLNPPDGANLNGYPAGDSVLVISTAGIAEATIYSGIQSGILNVRASCTSGGVYLHTIYPNIFIHSSPPSRIEVFAAGQNSGINMGGGLWQIIVGARVFDAYDNPVAYGASVWFHIPDNNFNCVIDANAYVGNESVEGDSTAGVAYTTLIYSGNYSLETIQIMAEAGGNNGLTVTGSANVILPLNQPQLELNITPGNLVFHGNTNPNPASATAEPNAYLFDGQGCPVHYVNVALTSTRGTFEYTTGSNLDPIHQNPTATPNIITTDGAGLAIGLIRFYAWEVPLGDPTVGCPGVTTVIITARIPGTDLSATGQTTLIRYPS